MFCFFFSFIYTGGDLNGVFMSFNYDLFDRKVRCNDVLLNIQSQQLGSLQDSLERKFDSLYYRIYKFIAKFFGLSCRFNFKFVDLTDEKFKHQFTVMNINDKEQSTLNVPRVMDYVSFLFGMPYAEKPFVERYSCVQSKKINASGSEIISVVYADNRFVLRLLALINALFSSNRYTFKTQSISLSDIDTSKKRKTEIASKIRIVKEKMKPVKSYIDDNGNINPDDEKNNNLVHSYTLINSFLYNLKNNKERLKELIFTEKEQCFACSTVVVEAPTENSPDTHTTDYYKEYLLTRFLSQSVFVSSKLNRSTRDFVSYLDFILENIQRFNNVCKIKITNDDIIDLMKEMRKNLVENNKDISSVFEEMVYSLNSKFETKKNPQLMFCVIWIKIYLKLIKCERLKI